MPKEHTSEEIKYRLSDLGAQIGNIAIEYITDLEAQIEKMKCCCLCVHCGKDCDSSGCGNPCDKWEFAE